MPAVTSGGKTSLHTAGLCHSANSPTNLLLLPIIPCMLKWTSNSTSKAPHSFVLPAACQIWKFVTGNHVEKLIFVAANYEFQGPNFCIKKCQYNISLCCRAICSESSVPSLVKLPINGEKRKKKLVGGPQLQENPSRAAISELERHDSELRWGCKEIISGNNLLPLMPFYPATGDLISWPPEKHMETHGHLPILSPIFILVKTLIYACQLCVQLRFFFFFYCVATHKKKKNHLCFFHWLVGTRRSSEVAFVQNAFLLVLFLDVVFRPPKKNQVMIKLQVKRRCFQVF